VPFSHLINAIFGTDVHYFGWEVAGVCRNSPDGRGDDRLRLGVQRFVFRHLVGQEPIILFMATIGLAYFLEGVADLMWGSEIRNLDVGLPQGINDAIDDDLQLFGYGFFIDNLDISAAVIARSSSAGSGRLRAIHQAGPRDARGGRRSPGGAVGGHQAQLRLGTGLVAGRVRRACRGRSCGARNRGCSSRCR
jgi:hypothetical protein